MRIRMPHMPRRPRRRAHDEGESCVRLHPPGHEDVLVAICETVGLWRIKAYDVDLYGQVSVSGDLDGFVDALLEAAAALESEHPDLSASFIALANPDESM